MTRRRATRPPRHEGVNYLLSEYGVGDFYRAFSISEHIDWQKISAEFKNGVLTVHLPKAETLKPKKITVKGEPANGEREPSVKKISDEKNQP